MFVNAAYSLALDGKFVKALEIINRARLRFPEGINPMVSVSFFKVLIFMKKSNSINANWFN